MKAILDLSKARISGCADNLAGLDASGFPGQV
jgi:hypothetical protein